ncbi:MAG: hypothetical protein L0Z50_07820 [Verrucomicrobiales bacterium]|nr:hypothetical protein [Verrucomicrobiales bacterium]
MAFLRKAELPVPEYREYFRMTLEAFYASPWHYVDGVGPDTPLPISLSGGDARRWTFEIRFKTELSLGQHLIAVFLPAAVASADTVLEHTAEWANRGVSVRPYRMRQDAGGRELFDETVRFIKDYLHWQD